MADQFGHSDEDLERSDLEYMRQREDEGIERANLRPALKALNDAAYAAIRAGKDTTLHPMLNREKLRQIARLTDEMVEQPDVT